MHLPQTIRWPRLAFRRFDADYATSSQANTNRTRRAIVGWPWYPLLAGLFKTRAYSIWHCYFRIHMRHAARHLQIRKMTLMPPDARRRNIAQLGGAPSLRSGNGRRTCIHAPFISIYQRLISRPRRHAILMMKCWRPAGSFFTFAFHLISAIISLMLALFFYYDSAHFARRNAHFV